MRASSFISMGRSSEEHSDYQIVPPMVYAQHSEITSQGILPQIISEGPPLYPNSLSPETVPMMTSPAAGSNCSSSSPLLLRRPNYMNLEPPDQEYGESPSRSSPNSRRVSFRSRESNQSASSFPPPKTTRSQSTFSVSGRGSAGDKSYLKEQQRRLSAVRFVAKTAKTKHRAFMGLNFLMILSGTLSIVLTIKDMPNANLGFRDMQKAKRAYFDLGIYPVSGGFMLLAGTSFDGFGMLVFLFGYCCECQYFRHYMRLVFINLLLSITAAVVLFLSEQNARAYLERYFMMTMTIDYASTTEPEAIDNFVDKIQGGSQCCGFNSPTDWKTTAWWEKAKSQNAVPQSCCDAVRTEMCTFDSTTLHNDGCQHYIFRQMGKWRFLVKYVALLRIAILVAVVVICSLLYKATYRAKIAKQLSESLSNRSISRSPLSEQNGDGQRQRQIVAGIGTASGHHANGHLAVQNNVYEDEYAERLLHCEEEESPDIFV